MSQKRQRPGFLVFFLYISISGAAWAEAPADFKELNLKELLDRTVTTATKTAQRQSEAPANIVLIDEAQIRRGGYRSVAEALEMVPGLATNTNHVFTNVGVRGISGGLRGGSRHIKLLIDGHPVAFRPDAQNFLGPELLPIETIARIEIIRGPASALYGRNAFLGVVNIVTKRARQAAAGAGSKRGARSERALRGSLGTIREGVSGSGELLLIDRIGRLSVTLGGYLGRAERSGLFLPQASSLAADYRGNEVSRADVARPRSAYGALELDLGAAGRVTLHGSYQELDSAGEFLDYGALSHGTRIHLRSWFTRLKYSLARGRFAAEAFAALSGGGDAGRDRILPMIDGKPTSQLVERDFGFVALDTGLDLRLSLLERSSLLAGLVYTHDIEQTRVNTFISPASGQAQRGRDQGDVDFDNVGLFAQALFGEVKGLQVAGNLRYDRHNIFGSSVNFRAAAVYAPTRWLTVKWLNGSSYRPPTPEQLYGTSIRPGGVEGVRAAGTGAEQLAAQRAYSSELSLQASAEQVRLQLDGYLVSVEDRIEYLLRQGNLEPANLADSLTCGIELSADGRHNRLGWQWLNLTWHASLSLQQTTISVGEERAALLTDREQELLEVNEIFPPWMVKWRVDLELPQHHLNVQLRMAVYGPRLESQLNQALGRAMVDDPLLEHGVSFPLDVVVSSLDLKLWRAKETRLTLALNDLLNTRSPEPGFNGIRIPALGRRIMLSVRQDL